MWSFLSKQIGKLQPRKRPREEDEESEPERVEPSPSSSVQPKPHVAKSSISTSTTTNKRRKITTVIKLEKEQDESTDNALVENLSVESLHAETRSAIIGSADAPLSRTNPNKRRKIAASKVANSSNSLTSNQPPAEASAINEDADKQGVLAGESDSASSYEPRVNTASKPVSTRKPRKTAKKLADPLDSLSANKTPRAVPSSRNIKGRKAVEAVETPINHESPNQLAHCHINTSNIAASRPLAGHASPVNSTPDKVNANKMPLSHQLTGPATPAVNTLSTPSDSQTKPVPRGVGRPRNLTEPPDGTTPELKEERRRYMDRERQRRHRQRKKEEQERQKAAERELMEQAKEERRKAMARERQRRHREIQRERRKPVIEEKQRLKEEAIERDRDLIASPISAKSTSVRSVTGSDVNGY